MSQQKAKSIISNYARPVRSPSAPLLEPPLLHCLKMVQKHGVRLCANREKLCYETHRALSPESLFLVTLVALTCASVVNASSSASTGRLDDPAPAIFPNDCVYVFINLKKGQHLTFTWDLNHFLFIQVIMSFIFLLMGNTGLYATRDHINHMGLFSRHFLDFSYQYNNVNDLDPCPWWQNITHNAFTVLVSFCL